jgi:hypothetical protein
MHLVATVSQLAGRITRGPGTGRANGHAQAVAVGRAKRSENCPVGRERGALTETPIRVLTIPPASRPPSPALASTLGSVTYTAAGVVNIVA